MQRRVFKSNGNSITVDLGPGRARIVGIAGDLNPRINSLVSEFIVGIKDSNVNLILYRKSDSKVESFIRQIKGWESTNELSDDCIPKGMTKEELFAIRPKGC